MILVELEIEDYKQFAGLHHFRPSPDGIIAIIGHNGAGKTTLFEAIEWCLYQPREINSNEIPPRGAVAKPRVRMVLHNPESGIRYVIQRWLSRSKVADAEIFREDDADSRIVQGSRATSEYVAKTLIGLSHRAFVSTFFTRQKELTFFGDLKETDRRREVGRLLGMETIREAQKLIADDRVEAQQHARSLELQLAEARADRDFSIELADADERITVAASSLSAAESALRQAESTHTAVRSESLRLAALEREDAAKAAEVERANGDIRAARAQRQTVQGELTRMDEAAAERGKLAAVAALAEPRRAALHTHDLARERFQALRRLQSDLERANGTLADVARDLRQTVSSVPVGAPTGWTWSNQDADNSVAAVRRLAAVASSVDADAIDLECSALTRVADLGEQLAKARAQATQYRTHLERLDSERAALIISGDPHERRETLTTARESCLREIDRSEARLKAIRQEIDRLQPVLERLRAQQDGAICPTCGRPIEGNDIEITVGLFSSNIADLEAEGAILSLGRATAAAEALRLINELKAAGEQAKALDTLNGRISDGGRHIAKAESDTESLDAELGSHLSATGLATLPTVQEISSANARLAIARKITSTLPLLRRLESSAFRAAEDRDTLARDLAASGEVTYEAGAHDTAKRDLSAAENAVARVAQIDSMLSSRPDRERDIWLLDAEVFRLDGLHAEKNAARLALHFDPAAFSVAREREQAAIMSERIARDARSAASATSANALQRRDTLLSDHQRIEALAQRAEKRALEAGELDTMYREFNGFEQFVADHLTPQLSDYTSELLRAITDGKYDQVVFTNNFGIEVFDGIEEHFPVDEFSGGERDVIALCARLALSRLIGGQANNPPGFMVLDEVFGSLDRDRRIQVLDALGSLAGSADAYRQLFIISHVDDVRSSPIFNEVWRVAEGPDGVSRLENLNVTGGFEDA